MEDFSEMLLKMLEESKDVEKRRKAWREEQEDKPGAFDSIRLTRVDFRDIAGRMFSRECSNTEDYQTTDIGRLFGIGVLLGKDNIISLNGLYADLFEEWLFGPVGGRSQFRTDPETPITEEAPEPEEQ